MTFYCPHATPIYREGEAEAQRRAESPGKESGVGLNPHEPSTQGRGVWRLANVHG
jgi:hypothetical protein